MLGWPKKDTAVERSAPLLQRNIRQAFSKRRGIHGSLVVDQEFAMNGVTDAYRARPRTAFNLKSLTAIDFASVLPSCGAEKSMSHDLSHVLCKRNMKKSRICICKLLTAHRHDTPSFSGSCCSNVQFVFPRQHRTRRSHIR